MVSKSFAGYILARYITHNADQKRLDDKEAEHNVPEHNDHVQSKGSESKGPELNEPECKDPEHKGPKCKRPVHKQTDYQKSVHKRLEHKELEKIKHKCLEPKHPNCKGIDQKEPESKQAEHKGTMRKEGVYKWQGRKKLVLNGRTRYQRNRKRTEHNEPQHMKPEHECAEHNVPEDQVIENKEPETWAEVWRYTACQCRRSLAAYEREFPPNTNPQHGGRWIPVWEYVYNPLKPSLIRYRLKEELDPLLWNYSCYPTFAGYIPVRRVYNHPVHGKILGEQIMTPKWDYTCYPTEKRASLVPSTPFPDEEAGIIVPCTLQSCPDKIIGQEEAAILQQYPERKIVSVELPTPLNSEPKMPPRVKRNPPKKLMPSMQPLTSITRKKFYLPPHKYLPPCQESPFLATVTRNDFCHESDYIMARRSALENVMRISAPSQEIIADNSKPLKGTLDRNAALLMDREKSIPSVKPLTSLTRKNFYLPLDQRFPAFQGSFLHTLLMMK